MAKWVEIRLSDLIDYIVDNRGKTPPLSDFGHELLEVNAITGTKRTPDYAKVRKYVSDQTFKTWFRKGHPKPDDILVPTVGTIGNVALVKDERGGIAQNLIALRCNQRMRGEFLYYYLASPLGKDLMWNLDIGGVQPSIKVPHLLDMAVSVPPVPEQKAIAEVLASLDDKIDLLHRQNQTLESLAETLFCQWFIIEASIDWEEKSLLDVVDLLGGGTPKTSVPEYWGGDIPWLSGGDIAASHKVFVMRSEKTITDQGVERSSA